MRIANELASQLLSNKFFVHKCLAIGDLSFLGYRHKIPLYTHTKDLAGQMLAQELAGEKDQGSAYYLQT